MLFRKLWKSAGNTDGKHPLHFHYVCLSVSLSLSLSPVITATYFLYVRGHFLLLEQTFKGERLN